MNRILLVGVIVALAGTTVSSSGCAPVVIAAAAGGAALVATDRRSAGAQLEDQTIETKLTAAIGSRFGELVHVNVTSYNSLVLLTGEVPDQSTWAEIGEMAKTTESVRSVQNELVIGPNADLASRSKDTYITSLVKTRFLESSQISTNHVKVVTERATVYLMGIVSRAEGDTASQIARTTSSVARVVKVFEYQG
jgi:osmotically-inducible protein OsmY